MSRSWLLVLLVGCGVSARESAVGTELDRLDAWEIGDREDAESRLIEMGPSILPSLRVMAGEAASEERRQRVARVIERLETQSRVSLSATLRKSGGEHVLSVCAKPGASVSAIRIEQVYDLSGREIAMSPFCIIETPSLHALFDGMTSNVIVHGPLVGSQIRVTGTVRVPRRVPLDTVEIRMGESASLSGGLDVFIESFWDDRIVIRCDRRSVAEWEWKTGLDWSTVDVLDAAGKRIPTRRSYVRPVAYLQGVPSTGYGVLLDLAEGERILVLGVDGVRRLDRVRLQLLRTDAWVDVPFELRDVKVL